MGATVPLPFTMAFAKISVRLHRNTLYFNALTCFLPNSTNTLTIMDHQKSILPVRIWKICLRVRRIGYGTALHEN